LASHRLLHATRLTPRVDGCLAGLPRATPIVPDVVAPCEGIRVSTRPRVSVVLPVFNGERYVRDAIASVVEQTYRDFEVIVVNDGSVDGTRAALDHCATHEKVRYVEQHRSGPGAARNLGIEQARGEIVAFLDHDDTWLPEKLALQVDYLDSHPEVGLVHTDMAFVDAQGNSIGYEQNWIDAVEGDGFARLFARNRIGTASVAVRRACLERVGVFSTDVRWAEDYELWLRIAREFPLGFINRQLVRYCVREDSWSSNMFHRTAGELAALESILRRIPDVESRVGGAGAVRARLHPLHRYMGRWLEWKYADYRSARHHYFRAWKNAPWDLDCLRRAAACALLPPAARKRIAWYGRRLSTRARNESSQRP
jgi:glycosyltransferase involved in cell wall biosynthesis